jgi:hypothetical protein
LSDCARRPLRRKRVIVACEDVLGLTEGVGLCKCGCCLGVFNLDIHTESVRPAQAYQMKYELLRVGMADFQFRCRPRCPRGKIRFLPRCFCLTCKNAIQGKGSLSGFCTGIMAFRWAALCQGGWRQGPRVREWQIDSFIVGTDI